MLIPRFLHTGNGHYVGQVAGSVVALVIPIVVVIILVALCVIAARNKETNAYTTGERGE